MSKYQTRMYGLHTWLWSKPAISSLIPWRLKDSFVEVTSVNRLHRASNGVRESWCICLSSSLVQLAARGSEARTEQRVKRNSCSQVESATRRRE